MSFLDKLHSRGKILDRLHSRVKVESRDGEVITQEDILALKKFANIELPNDYLEFLPDSGVVF